MKKIVFLFILLGLLMRQGVMGQVNLVPNPSFEIDTACVNPNSSIADQMDYAPPWHSSSGSCDYYNSCSTTGIPYDVNVPNSWVGWQYARTGVAYAGFVASGAPEYPDAREYLQTKLDSVLKQNHIYCIEFYVNLPNNWNMAVNNIGMYMSDNMPPTPGCVCVYSNCIPQINDTIPITDTVGWTRISGQYTAHGGEQYITIGNFYNDAQTDTIYIAHHNGWDGSYYFIDDISLVDCTPLGVQEIGTTNNEIELMPNPASTSITLTTHNPQPTTIAIYNVLGEVVISHLAVVNSQSIINISQLSKGVYFVEVQTAHGVFRKKFVKE